MNGITDLFPKWTNGLRVLVAIGLGLGVVYVGGIVTFGFSPYATDVGYMPTQPVPYSHKIHAGTLGIDCRYCHNTVEHAAKAAIPPTMRCIGCHKSVLPESTNLTPVYASYNNGTPIEWLRVHDLPDYAYFNHSAHVTRGIGCVTCHGRVDKMEVVHQVQPLSMNWCLDCHRAPEKFLRPVEEVTNMEWDPLVALGKTQLELGHELREQYGINPSMDCSTCHR